ncbi:MAG: LpqB family beta-propeller domain-containing protein [Microlunatus sp.]|nr:LpqB family beta-propeller domain-containing protein [Microlunatus sp.]
MNRSVSSPRHRWVGCRRLVLAVMVVALGLVAGCVGVPTSGPVVTIDGQAPECQNCIDVDVAPPAAGNDPKQIVQGFLRATSNFQPNYAVARQFLTTGAGEKWAPESGVSIYSGSIQAAGDTVILDGRLVGSLGPDRTYTGRDKAWRVNFGMVKEDGEWRISTPPPGLMVAEFAFDSFYQTYNLFFVGNGSVLVPNPIHLADLRSQASTASVLISALLAGPSRWLAPAVTSAIPEKTALSVDAVTIDGGVAEVALSDDVLNLNEGQRTLMAAQVLYTLRPLGIRGVAFTVDQQPYAIPGADPGTFVVSLDARFQAFDPIPSGVPESIFTARAGKVGVTTSLTDTPDSTPITGRLGAGKWSVDEIAVSPTASDIAAVTDGGKVLRAGEVANGGVRTVIDQVTGLLRPNYTRFSELWAIGDSGKGQRLWVERDGKVTEVRTTLLKRGRVRAFSISPDGVRMALIREVDGRSELGLARIVRGDGIRLDGWLPLDVTSSTTPNLSVLRDLSWSDSTSLAVLGGSSADVPLAVYRISQDASATAAVGEPITWDATGLAVALKSQTVIVLDRDGQTWRDGRTQWVSFLDKVSAVACPG